MRKIFTQVEVIVLANTYPPAIILSDTQKLNILGLNIGTYAQHLSSCFKKLIDHSKYKATYSLFC